VLFRSAVADTPGDVYLPELKAYLPVEDDNFSSFDFAGYFNDAR